MFRKEDLVQVQERGLRKPVSESHADVQRELYIRQVADRALPTPLVLNQQRQARGPEGPPQVFVP
jgi:hypothetical protein